MYLYSPPNMKTDNTFMLLILYVFFILKYDLTHTVFLI